MLDVFSNLLQPSLERCRDAQSRSRLNGEDQLAAGVAANAALESLARLSEQEHGRHDWWNRNSLGRKLDGRATSSLRVDPAV
jgi:hypothetical protein